MIYDVYTTSYSSEISELRNLRTTLLKYKNKIQFPIKLNLQFYSDMNVFCK